MENKIIIDLPEELIAQMGHGSLIGKILELNKNEPLIELKKIILRFPKSSGNYRRKHNGPRWITIPEYVIRCIIPDIIYLTELGIEIKIETYKYAKDQRKNSVQYKEIHDNNTQIDLKKDKIKREIIKATAIVDSIPKVKGLRQWSANSDKTFEIIKIWLGIEKYFGKHAFASEIGMNSSTLCDWTRKYQNDIKKYDFPNASLPKKREKRRPSDIKYDLSQLGKETDTELAKKWGISRERVRQLRARHNISKFTVDIDYKNRHCTTAYKKKYCKCQICKACNSVAVKIYKNFGVFNTSLSDYFVNKYFDLYELDKTNGHEKFYEFMIKELELRPAAMLSRSPR